MPPFVSVKEAVFPFNKFSDTDPVLGPEMRSTGEVMGISDSFGSAFAKAQLAASQRPAARGLHPHHRERLRQGDGDADRASLPRDGIQALRDARHGELSARARHSGELGVQGARGTAELPRHDRERRRRSCSSTRRSASTPSGTTTRCARRRSASASRTRRRCRRPARRRTRSCRCKSRRPAVRSLQEWQQDILDAAAVEV